MNIMFTILFVVAIACGPTLALRQYRNSGCEPNKLTVYKVFVQTNWNREVFPKQYPEWRPPAQWSKLIGRSHTSSYVLFHLGEAASDGMKQFAETGATEVLEDESQGVGGIFDEFNAPPIGEGVGESESEFFVDGNHSMVSLAARVIPSPDWFIGIDSFDLCVEGKWIESVMLEVDPLDAGTDNGFTFTSPNWPTVPQNPITRITSQTPSHPANSFFYPDRLSHPPIATFHIAKVKEYELSRVFPVPSSPGKPSKPTYTSTSHTSHRDIYRTLNEIDNEIPSPYRGYDVSSANEVHIPHPSTIKMIAMASPAGTKSTKHQLINSLVKKYRKKFKKNRKGRKMATRRVRKPRDCRVSEWGEYSACSKTCGIGEQIRKRDVLKHSRRGGRPCPLLEERKWCGSSRDCKKKYFDW